MTTPIVASSAKVPAGDRGVDVKRVTVLGATGSIGESTLDLIGRNPDRFEVVALTAHGRAGALAKHAIAHRAQMAVVADEKAYSELKAALAGTGIAVGAGQSGLLEAAAAEADCTVAAIVGAAGLKPTLRAVAQGRRLALANKECLVSAGAVFMAAVAAAGTELLPVDSEHSAAFQALGTAAPQSIEQILLTASGGPFRTWSMEQLAAATPEQAVRHPTWSMGQKISVDSATMMNKALELIEAYHLFPVSADQLGVVVHPQSIVHCLVAYVDGSVLAQMSCPDMRTPIALSLSWPARMVTPTERLDLAKLKTLSFEEPDHARFPSIRLAGQVLARGGAAPAILNAANEVAVDAFLRHRIGFLDIARTAAATLDRAEGSGLMREPADIEEVMEIDRRARDLAQSLM